TDTEVELDPAAAQQSLQDPGRLGVGAGDDLIHHLEDVNLAADVGEERRKLTADHAAADDGDTSGLGLPVEGVIRGDDGRAVDLIARDRPGWRACGHAQLAGPE